MSVSGGLSKLKQAAKTLRLEWDETHTAWRDENAARFEKNVVLPLLTRLRDAESTIANLDTILRELHRDCD